MLSLLFIGSPDTKGQYFFDFEAASTRVSDDSLATWRQFPEGRWGLDSLHALSGRASLHHAFDNTESACDWLILRHDAYEPSAAIRLSFQVRHAFNPSTSNNWQLVLGAALNEDSEAGPVLEEGLVVGVNFQGSNDLLSLWSVGEGSTELICTSTMNFQEDIGRDDMLSVELDIYEAGTSGVLSYSSGDTLSGRVEFKLQGFPPGRHCILRYEYTSARDRSLWLDDLSLEGEFMKDTLPPFLECLELDGRESLLLHFSEAPLLPTRGNFQLKTKASQGFILPSAILQEGPELNLTFSTEIPNRREHELLITGLKDGDGNSMKDSLCAFIRNEAVWGDVIISEILADPNPVVEMEREFLEIYNRSAYLLDLNGWSFEVNGRSYSLDRYRELKGLLMEPETFLYFEGIPLPNDGALLALRNEFGVLLHSLAYELLPGSPDWKQEGGWSMELSDTDALCNSGAYLHYSQNPRGGTPGRANSIGIGMEEAPAVFDHFGISIPDSSIYLTFSGRVSVSDTLFYMPLSILEDSWVYRYGESPFSAGAMNLTVSSFSDCVSGESLEFTLSCERLMEALPGSVFINELMFDPFDGEPEFIELKVGENGSVDLDDFYIRLAGSDGIYGEPLALTGNSRIAGPGQYLVLTRFPSLMQMSFTYLQGGELVELVSMPAMNNTEGSIVLQGNDGEMVDLVNYSIDMHSPLLATSDGISLERISVDRAGDLSSNWHSAASSVQATPGRPNSQALQSVTSQESEDLLYIEPISFSPDNDGYQDVLKVIINPGRSGCLLNLRVTDSRGRLLKELAALELIGPEAGYFWDGCDTGGRKQPTGFYLLQMQLYDPATGQNWKRRRAIGLFYR